jgi:hypothetical protein
MMVGYRKTKKIKSPPVFVGGRSLVAIRDLSGFLKIGTAGRQAKRVANNPHGRHDWHDDTGLS